MRPIRFAGLLVLVYALISATGLSLAQPGAPLQARYGQTQKLIASDVQAFAEYGRALALSHDGQVLVVAAPLQEVADIENQGQVYVYRHAGDTWNEVQRLIASDGAAGDVFGSALAISTGPEYTILIGAPGQDGDGTYETALGAAYIFTYNGTTWSQQTKLEPVEDNPFSFNNRGAAVAISADGLTAFVGAPGVDVGGTTTPEGVVYVFTWSGDNWEQVQRIDGSIGETDFGWSLHLSDGEGYLLAGSGYIERTVHIYQQIAGSWTKISDLIPSDNVEFSRYGAGIATANGGDLVMVGAPLQDGTQGPEDGKVYIFSKSGDVWVESGSILCPEGIYHHFGESIALAPDGAQVVVGAWLNGSGAVYHFEQAGSNWHVRQRFTTAGIGDQLGYAVAFREETIIAGARWEDAGDLQWAGAIYVYNPVEMSHLPLIMR